jgi:serine/threonine protein kinase
MINQGDSKKRKHVQSKLDTYFDKKTYRAQEKPFDPTKQNWSLIGQGGQGTVYRTPQDQAVKVVDLANGKGWRAIIDDISIPLHPNLQEVLLVDTYPTFPYSRGKSSIAPIALEYQPLASGDLFEKIENEKFSQTKALKWFYDILCGLVVLHQQNIIHNDIKPENILIIEEKHGISRAVIADFGFITRDSSAPCHWGTRQFKAPELVNGSIPCSKAGDVYAAGLVMLELFVPKKRVIEQTLEKSGYTNFKQFYQYLQGEILDAPTQSTVFLQHMNDEFIDKYVMTWGRPELRKLIRNFQEPPSGLKSSSELMTKTLKLQQSFLNYQKLFYKFFTTNPVGGLLQKMLRWNHEDRITAESALQELIELISKQYESWRVLVEFFDSQDPTTKWSLDDLKEVMNELKTPPKVSQKLNFGLDRIFIDKDRVSTADILSLLETAPEYQLLNLTCPPPTFHQMPMPVITPIELTSALEKYKINPSIHVSNLLKSTADMDRLVDSYQNAVAIVNAASGIPTQLLPKHFPRYYNMLNKINWHLDPIFARPTTSWPKF